METYEIRRRFGTEVDATSIHDWNDATDQAGGFWSCDGSKNVNEDNAGCDHQLEQRTQSSPNRFLCNFAAINLKAIKTSISSCLQFSEKLFCNSMLNEI